MLKSLGKLENGIFGLQGSGTASSMKAQELADEIQAEIDRYYLPRPLFEDGEPADFGMEYVTGREEVETIELFVFSEDDVDINSSNPSGQQVGWSTWWNRPLRHSIESDTQEKIDADCDLSVQEYCKKYHINPCWTASLVRKHLLARQRKLDTKRRSPTL